VTRTPIVPGIQTARQLIVRDRVTVTRLNGDEVDGTVGDRGLWNVTRRGSTWACDCAEAEPCEHIVAVRWVSPKVGEIAKRRRRRLWG
jgi:hypothetical protein